MLYPSISQLTHDEVNRYRLVIATAKCARHVNDVMNEIRAVEEGKSEEKNLPQESFDGYDVKNSVSIAVHKLADGDYAILDKDN